MASFISVVRGVSVTASAFCLLAASSPAQAGAGDVVACLAVKDPTERLACYDKTVQALDADMKENTTSWFGWFHSGATKDADFGATEMKSDKATSSANAAASGDGKPPPPAIPEITSITSKLIAIADPNGRPVFQLANGQIWRAQNAQPAHMKDGIENVVKIERSWLGYQLTLNDQSHEVGVERIR